MDPEIEEIAKILAANTQPHEIYAFLQTLLSPAELGGVSKRWALLKRLEAGRSQRSIAGELGISLCKITRGAKELQKENPIVLAFIQKSKELRNG